MNRLFCMMLLALLLLPTAVLASDNQWSGSGPFATGLGNRVITALAVSSDGKTVYAGSGSGTVFSYAYTPPTVTTGAASGLSATGATLNGTVNANNADATVGFEYGLTVAYGATVASTQATVTGTSDTAVSAPLSGLLPGTIYHYRINAVNSGGTNNGTDQTFTTWLAPAFGSASATSFTYNSPGSFVVTASGIPAPAFTTASTLPGGVTLNSNGTLSGTPAQSGSFPITITATNSAGTVDQSFTLTVNKATPTATLAVGNSPLVYSGSPQAATVTISASSAPGAVANIITGGSADKTAAGSYAVTADFVPADSANYNILTGLSAGTLVINKATATVTLGSLLQAWDGTPKAATATTSPAGKSVLITYNGSAGVPSAIGSYAVAATISDPNYQGSASATLTISDQGNPEVNAFTAQPRANSLTVDTVITATDNLAVSGYCVSESAGGSGCSWSASASGSFTFGSEWSKQLYAFARDAAGNISPAFGPVAVTVSIPALAVHVAVNGTLANGLGGTVTSVPAGISCSNSVKGTVADCSYDFSGTVNLYATPSALATFGGWGGDCPAAGPCSVSMTGNRSVTATFNQATLLHIGGTEYGSLQAAYDAASAGAVIQLLDGSQAGVLNAGRNVYVTLKGGYDSAYNANNGATTLTAPLTIGQGTVVVEKVEIR